MTRYFLAGLVTLAAILAAALLWRRREASTPEGLPNIDPAPDEWDDWLSSGVSTADVPVWLAQCGHRHQWGLACSVTAA